MLHCRKKYFKLFKRPYFIKKIFDNVIKKMCSAFQFKEYFRVESMTNGYYVATGDVASSKKLRICKNLNI